MKWYPNVVLHPAINSTLHLFLLCTITREEGNLITQWRGDLAWVQFKECTYTNTLM